MTGDGSTFRKSRPALADVTNQLGKRVFSEISSNADLESRDGYQKNVEGASQFGLQFYPAVKNLVKGKGKLECIEDSNLKDLSSMKAKQLCGSVNSGTRGNSPRGNAVSGVSRIPDKIKEPLSLLGGDLHLVRGDSAINEILEIGDASRDSCISSILVPTGLGQCNKSGYSPSFKVGEEFRDKEGRVTDVTSNYTESCPVNEGLTDHVFRNDDKELGGDGGLASNESNSIGFSRPFKSLGSKLFGLERCTSLNGDGPANTSAGVDLLKACSCSFCVKGVLCLLSLMCDLLYEFFLVFLPESSLYCSAYMWSDLHYQDIKGRIAALKSSQKEVRILVERSCNHGQIDTNGQGKSKETSKLEFDLMGRWRSLFLHTEDILARESNQLQSSLVSLKELRGNCKMDLEMINEMPSNEP
ncbi:hypothetical protein HHK36_030664 [Tetracentron sinense]|uniref:Uncharacterized protein n=1 Tax=Tetracentron sinense TaxID=13715 RepID=A0A834YD85_TETSI|nr:hypothetical protein HHK36_030664 [Tetracentron sinense]